MTQKLNSRFGSEDGGGASWHPPRGFHLLRGEAFTWIYGLAILDTIHMIEKEQQKDSREILLKSKIY
jgi:hypothetical protein